MTDETAIEKKADAQLMESVLLQGDLSKLSPAQRVSYYQKVCESTGLNPLTRPFDYLNLNGKLTLYARKDATDQLRNINGVSIDDVDIVETATQFIVKVKGHNKDGRTDVEVGVVNKTDMQGNLANIQMKGVTKAKRRLTLSLCGLGWLDETEVETIPGARVIPAEIDEVIPVEKKTDVGARPYAPDMFKEKFVIMVEQIEKKGDTVLREKEADILASVINSIFDGDKTMRYTFTRWLCGHGSTKKLSPVQVRCLMTVMGVANFGDPPSAVSMTEIRQAHTFALKAEGQAELPMEAKK